MRSVESEIEGVLAKRLGHDVDPAPRTPLQRVEDFALAHVRSLTFGAVGALATLVAALSFSGQPEQNLQADPVIVGSISEMPRVSPRIAWKTVPKPIEMIALQAPQFGRVPQAYLARQSDSGDREDALIFEPGNPTSPRRGSRCAAWRPFRTSLRFSSI